MRKISAKAIVAMHGKEYPPKAKDHIPDAQRHNPGEARSQEATNDRREAKVLEEQHGCVGSHREERGVPQRQLTSVPSDEVPRSRECRKQIEGHPDMDDVPIGNPEGYEQQRDKKRSQPH